jgi:hypothetical protein
VHCQDRCSYKLTVDFGRDIVNVLRLPQFEITAPFSYVLKFKYLPFQVVNAILVFLCYFVHERTVLPMVFVDRSVTFRLVLRKRCVSIRIRWPGV